MSDYLVEFRVSLLQSDGESLITPDAIAAVVGAPSAQADPELQLATAEVALILNMVLQRFKRQQDPAITLDQIAAQLHRTRHKFRSAVWRSLVPVIQNHPVMDYVLQDPFTRWSFGKPRGYSGDAQLLDFIYGHPSVDQDIADANDFGRTLYQKTRQSQSSCAVRERRDLLTRYVDGIAASRAGSAEILTVAAGHLREADASIALRDGSIKRWVALDQDPLSVGSMIRDFQGTRVDAIDGSVKGLVTRAYNLGTFDFIYAAGLYDYLPRSVAIKLTRRCMSMLKPGGTFLFANFAEGIQDDAFMETFMNWSLLLRSEDEMWDIVNASVDRNTVDARVFAGENRNIFYGTIEKRN